MTTIKEVQKAYELLIRGIDDKAKEDEDRAYGGIIRAGKGLLVESIGKNLIEIAWDELGGKGSRLTFLRETIKIPLKVDYLSRVRPKEVAEYIKANIDSYFYGLKTDIHVNIDGRFVLGVECKAYTENAMLKRILVDFTLLKQRFPDLKCSLLQLESQLTGDYSNPSKNVVFGSHSTHTLLSYFDVDLQILTLLEGERKVEEPIHQEGFYKELSEQSLKRAVDKFKEILHEYI